MGFDIGGLDSSRPSDDGREMEVLRLDGTVVRDDEGKALTITLRGRLSRAVQNCEREIQVRRLDAARRGRRPTIEDAEAEITEGLVAATKAWSFTMMDGEPFPCTQENARKFWSDPRFIHIREQAIVFMREDARFTLR